MKRFSLLFFVFISIHICAQNDTILSLPEGPITYSLRDGWSTPDGTALSEQQYISLTATYCPDANRKYITAKRLATAGKWTTVAGVPFTILGVAFLVYHHEDSRVAAYSLTAVGGALLLTGIPIYAVGISRKKQSVATFNLCTSTDGLGISVNF